MAEEPVAFVRQDSETSSSASKVATLAGVTAVIVALAGFWLFTSRRKKARAAASLRHRRHN
jgi:LPXTG-motif cell wall-anchored protein